MSKNEETKVDGEEEEVELEHNSQDSDGSQDSNDSAGKPVDVNEIKQKVVDYVKIDDKLRDLMKEMKKLKDQRKQPEEKIKTFFKKSKMDYIGIDGDDDKIVKEEVEKKTAVKTDMIQEAIKECLLEDKVIEDEEKCIELVKKIVDKIEKKRLVTKSVNIKRDKKPKKEKKEKKKRNQK